MRTRTLLATVLLSAVALASQAQTPQKIGYADWEYIFSNMPEAKQIDAELKTHGTQLDNQLKAKYAEYESKVKAFQALPPSTTELIKADKAGEIQRMEESIQKFQQDAQASIAKKQNDLMAPVFTKVGKAIEDVAKENGYTFIINPQLGAGSDILLYSDEKFDISDLVLKKMGITPPPAGQK
jgi:outer membrane protein